MKFVKLTKERLDEYILLVKQLSKSAGYTELQSDNLDTFINNVYKDIYLCLSNNDNVIGTISVIKEQKLNRISSTDRIMEAWHIEECITDSYYRGFGIGKSMVDFVVSKAKEAGNVYKIILDCSLDNVEFYKKCGFKQHEVCMRIDINEG